MTKATPVETRTSAATWIAALAAVALGASTVYYALDARAARRVGSGGDGAAAAARADRSAAERPAAAAGAPGDDLRRLRAENAALKRRLFDLESAPAPEGRAAPDGGALRTWRDRLEELRKTDPEQFKRIMERRAQRRAEVEESVQEQLAALDRRLEALGEKGSKEETELLNKMASLMTELTQLNDKMQALAQLPEAERVTQAQALAQQGRELYGQLAALRAEDRTLQLQQLGGQLGLSAEQAAQLATSVDRIVKDTDSRGMRPRVPGGGGGRGR